MGHEKDLVETIVNDLNTKPGDGNDQDRVDMLRLGRKQELLRTFRFFSVLAFVVILQSTWEGVLLTSQLSFGEGGLAGSIYLFISVWLGMVAVIASIAEMASMAPTAGGQYHYVSELAPRNMQAFLSYLVAWFSCLGWVAGNPAVAQQVCGLVTQMVLISYPDADIGELWQATLIAMAFMFLAFFFNFFLARRLALAESMILVVHVLAFVVFIIIFWTMSPHTDATTVFTSTYNGSGWSTQGFSVLVGIVAPLWCLAGSDCGAHMSEELEDASLQLPRAMMWSVTLNGIFGIVMLITFCFCITDLDGLLGDDSTMPVVQILYAATQSNAGTLVLCSVLVLLSFFGLLTNVATTSRQIWAFARDQGLPFSNWIHQVSTYWNVPFNALLASLAISFVLLCINFGSDVALNAILSVSNAALLFTYIIAIGCVRLKRLRGEPLLPRRWSLGSWGGMINDFALAFLAVAFVFSFFPEAPSIGDDTWVADFNWAIVIFAAWMVISVGLWFVGGARHRYVPPVMLVKPIDVTQ
ncbi:hypothetical protein AMS68_001977 [Peltaster fructicola]|uniref:Amino acid permease/ SLC12A domain-containing protein n=1 Tax=Peltaster fructicola TaxID=286661 RepID=A0A6H0XPQ2_9PEZI|nr:hypothetical protein AMS68_001977 [Peltaster fructicola]